MNDEARRLLEQAEAIIGLELEPAPAYMQPDGKLKGAGLEVFNWLKSARAFLAQPEPAAREAVLAQGERLREVMDQPGPNVEGCTCERDGDEDSPLCPMHVSKFGVLRKETLSFLLVDYEAQFEAFRAALAPREERQ